MTNSCESFQAVAAADAAVVEAGTEVVAMAAGEEAAVAAAGVSRAGTAAAVPVAVAGAAAVVTRTALVTGEEGLRLLGDGEPVATSGVSWRT